MVEKLRIPLLVVTTFIGVAVGAGIAWGVTNEKVEQLERHEERHEDRDRQQSVDIQELKTESKNHSKALDRIEARLGTK